MDWQTTKYRDSSGSVRIAKTADNNGIYYRIPLRLPDSDKKGKYRLYVAKGRNGHWTFTATKTSVAVLIAIAEAHNLVA